MYHLSEYHANLVSLKPEVPDGFEGDVPRVCVAPTIMGCLRALGADYGQGYNVYAIDEQTDVSNLEVCRQGLVSDAHRSGEARFTREVPCRWVGFVTTVGVI